MPAATRRSSTASSTPRSIAARPCSTRATTAIQNRRSEYTYGTRRHPDDPLPRGRLDRARGRRRHGADALGPRRRHGRAALLPQGRRPPPGDRFRLPPDPGVLRRVPRAVRGRDHLLRPHHRGRHRGADAREHGRRAHRGAGLAELRDAGHPGHRASRPRPRRLRPDGQHLGDAAALPAARAWGRHRHRGRHQVPVGRLGPAARPDVRQCQVLAGPAPDLRQFSMCAGAEDVFLALRGLRTLPLRLREHGEQALALARWFQGRPEVARVLHRPCRRIPATRSGRATSWAPPACSRSSSSPAPRRRWRRCSTGWSCSGWGFSWGGFESLVIPFDCAPYRSANPWAPGGPGLRFQVGLEDLDDLTRDLDAGFARLAGGIVRRWRRLARAASAARHARPGWPAAEPRGRSSRPGPATAPARSPPAPSRPS